MTGAGGDPAKIPKLMINEESDKNIEYNHSPENVFSEQKESENSDDAKRTDLKIQPDNGMNAPTFILQGAQNQDFQSNTMILNDSGHDDFQAKTMILEDSKSDDFQSNTMILNDSDNDGLQAHTLILAGNQKKKTIQSGLSGNTFILPETENIRIRELDLRKFSISNINPVKSHQTLVDSENGPGADSVFLPEAGAGSEQSQKSAESHDIQSMNSRSSGGNLKKQNFYGSKASLPSVGEIIGHYKIISELGRGGFGAVYYAQNMILGRDEALKLILPSARTEFKDTEMRFVREINIVARLEHPNIVRLYSSGHLASGMLWMTMELIRGERLMELLKQPQYTPYAVEDQIVSVWAGLNGYIDDVPVAKVSDYEKGRLDYVRRNTNVMDVLVETGKWTDEASEDLKKATETFTTEYLAAEGISTGIAEDPSVETEDAQEQIHTKRG